MNITVFGLPVKSGFLGSVTLDTIQHSPSFVLGPSLFFHVLLAEPHGVHSWEGQGGRTGVWASSALGVGLRLTLLSALQFSNLREEKKHQEIMGLIEKENLILRQVTA